MVGNMLNAFEIGGQYRNRAGYFEVIELQGESMRVLLENGEVCVYDVKIQLRIQNNLGREERSIFPVGIAKEAESDFITTVGALAKVGDFVAEVPTKAISGFKNSYKSVTGEFPQGTGYYELRQGADKWGSELRIGFPEHIQLQDWFTLPDGIHPAPRSQNGISRINNNSLWWHLVERLGFRLGSKQNLTVIAGNVSPNFIDAFELGVDWR